MSIVIRSGKQGDMPWIVALLQEGAQQGHFGPTVASQAAPLLNAIFNGGGFMMMKLRGGIQAPCFVTAAVLVAEIDGTPASFLIPLKDGNEVELHLAGTRKQFRRKGCFRELTRYEVGKHTTKVKIFARCYKKSTWAVEALKKENFEITKSGDPVELSLSR